MAFEAYEQLWDVSHEFLEKHVSFVNSLTKLMMNRSNHLRCYVLDAEARKRTMNDFVSNFKKSHDELQSMGKSLQRFVSDWDGLFGDETASFEVDRAPELDSNFSLTFDYIKPSLTYEKVEKLNLTITFVPTTEDGIFYAVDKTFYGQYADFIASLQQVHKVPLTHLPPPGTVFLIQIQNLWNRAVRNVSQGHCSSIEPTALYLLDMGETYIYEEKTPKAVSPTDVVNVPAYAIKCRLSSKNISKSLEPYRTISCKVVSIENNELKVDEIEKENEFAITRDTFTEEELKQLDDLPTGTTNAMKAVLGYVPQDDMRICKFTDPTAKRCFKGSHCRLRHEEKDPDGWTLDKDTVSVSVSVQMEVPSTNSYIYLLPTFVIDVDRFYAQIISKDEKNEAFGQLMADMNDEPTIGQHKRLKRMPALGQLVLALFEDVWYRATVYELFDDSVSVFYVDYGNVANVCENDVRECEDRFKSIPFQAVCCRISNVRRVKPCHIEAISQLNHMLLDQTLKALIIDNKYPWEVQLFDEDDFDIGQALVMAKLALPREPSKFDHNAAVPG